MITVEQGGLLDKLFSENGLASQNLRVATDAAKSLRWAVVDNKVLQQEAREAGAMPLLARLLQPELTDDAAVRAACVAIYTLSHRNHGCQDAGGTTDIVPRLLVLLGGGAGPLAEQTQVDVCTALGLLCVGHRANQAAAHRHGAVEVLISIAGYGRHEEGRLRACFTLGCMSAANPALRSAIVMAGGVRAAVALLPPHAPPHGHDAADVRRKRLQALAALRDMTLGHRAGQLDAISSGALPLLLHLLREHPLVAASAAETLSAVLAGDDDTQRELKISHGMHELTTQLVRCDDGKGSGQPAPSEREYLCSSVCHAIESLACGDPACQTAANSSGEGNGPEDASRGPTALEALLSLVSADDTPPRHPQVVAAALGAINACIGGHEANRDFVLARNVAPAILAVLKRQKESCPGAAFGGLATLAWYDDDVYYDVVRELGGPHHGTRNGAIGNLLEKLSKRVPHAPPGADEPSEDSPLAPIATFMRHEVTSANDQRRDTKEAAIAMATLIGVIAARGAACVEPLRDFDAAALFWSMDLGADAAHAAISCAMQLYHHGGLSPTVMVAAMRLERNQHGVGRGAEGLVKHLVPAHHWRRLETLAELPKATGTPAAAPTDIAALRADELAKAAAALLIAMAPAEGAREMLHVAGAATALASALRTQDAMSGADGSLIQIAAFGCAVSSYPPAQDAAARRGAVAALLHLLKHASDSTRLRCLGALANLCAGHSANREQARWMGGIPLVCALLRPTGLPEGTAGHAVVALLHLASNDVDGQRAIEDEGGVAALAAFWIRYYEDEASRSAAERALYELAFDHERTGHCTLGEREKPRGFRIVYEAKEAARSGRLVWEDGPMAWKREWARWRKERTRPRGDDVIIDVGDDGDEQEEGWVRTRMSVGALRSSRAW